MSLPPPPVERSHPIRDWTARQGLRLAAARARREARELDDAPRFRLHWPWSGAPDAARGGHQTLRAFVQINVLPRPR